MNKKLFIFDQPAKGVSFIDHNHLNNGGHNEYKIFEIPGFKSRASKYCVVCHDVYGKAESRILTKAEVIEEFGEEVIFKLL